MHSKDCRLNLYVTTGVPSIMMSRSLNILTALLLTIVPVLRPCACDGFKFYCACALPAHDHEAQHAHADASRDDVCPCEASLTSAIAASKVPDCNERARKPQPPHAPGGCAMSGDLSLVAAIPVATATQTDSSAAFAPMWYSLCLPTARARPALAHFERPPPWGLVLVGISCIRI